MQWYLERQLAFPVMESHEGEAASGRIAQAFPFLLLSSLITNCLLAQAMYS